MSSLVHMFLTSLWISGCPGSAHCLHAVQGLSGWYWEGLFASDFPASVSGKERFNRIRIDILEYAFLGQLTYNALNINGINLETLVQLIRAQKSHKTHWLSLQMISTALEIVQSTLLVGRDSLLWSSLSDALDHICQVESIGKWQYFSSVLLLMRRLCPRKEYLQMLSIHPEICFTYMDVLALLFM